ncbi:MAG: inactive serine/threonine-protein kinase VRK3, partial [Deinococcales bacterium]
MPAGTATDMITCPACGRLTSPASRTCPECGAPLTEPTGVDRTPAVGGNTTLGTSSSSDAPPTHMDDDETLLPGDVPGSHAGASSPRNGEPLAIGQMFGGRYRIACLLGVGGMGAVYEAFDEKVGTRVALKVVRLQGSENHELTRQLDRRFKRELLLARQVTHKNVVRIHDLGEIDGITYITMSYVEGESLAQVLDHRGHLSV